MSWPQFLLWLLVVSGVLCALLWSYGWYVERKAS